MRLPKFLPLMLLGSVCLARQLPLKFYTTENGLPRDEISKIRAVSK